MITSGSGDGLTASRCIAESTGRPVVSLSRSNTLRSVALQDSARLNALTVGICPPVRVILQKRENPVPCENEIILLKNSGRRQLLTRLLLLAALQGLCASIVHAQTKDVTWLSEVAQDRGTISVDGLGRLDPLLVDTQNQKLTTVNSWETKRDHLRQEWLRFLGPMPNPRPPVKLEILREETLDQMTRQLVRYEGEPGIYVEGYLLRPKNSADRSGPFPAIVALHQTTNSSIDEIAGVSGPDSMQLGSKLAARGFFVFCPRCFLWQDAENLNDAVAQHRKRHSDSLGMAKMLYDAMRGVDVLVSLPEVDSRRIGAIGHSLGAKEVLYLAAFDDRVRASVFSEGGMGFRSTNWDAPWYLGEAIRDENFPLNHHQLLAMIAPRPILVIGGERGPGAADGDRSWPLIKAAIPVWELYGKPVRMGLLNHGQGHTVSMETFDRMAEWLEHYLDP